MKNFPTLLVDDHALIREGVRRALAETPFHVTREAATLAEARAILANASIEIIILDINLPLATAQDTIEFVEEHSQKSRIAILTANASYEEMQSLQRAGAMAYVMKSSPISELINALGFITTTESNYPNSFLAPTKQLKSPLTQRETEILLLLPTGFTSREIASLLFLSEATVKTHLSSIYRKLAATNRVQAIEAGAKYGLLSFK